MRSRAHTLLQKRNSASRGITGEAMGMAISSVRATIQRDNPQRGSQDSGSLAAMGTRNPAVSVGGVGLVNPEGGKGTTAGQVIGKPIDGILGGSGGGDGGCGDGYEDCVNQLEEDRKIRHRQVERTAHRLSRVSAFGIQICRISPLPVSPPPASDLLLLVFGSRISQARNSYDRITSYRRR